MADQEPTGAPPLDGGPEPAADGPSAEGRPTPEQAEIHALRAQVAQLTDLVLRMASAMNLGDMVDPQQFPQFEALRAVPPPQAAGRPAKQSPKPEPAPKVQKSVVKDPARQSILDAPEQALTFSSTHDGQGLMALLGTLGGRQKWMNPVEAGLVQVRASKVASHAPKGRRSLYAEVGDSRFTGQCFFTANVEYSWVMVDFGTYQICPTHYTFAHRTDQVNGKDVGYYPRNWELHGSVDGQTWDGIRRHNNDETLCQSQKAATWPIPRKTSFYSKFRVALDPKGNSKGTSALVVSCFEIYGACRHCP
mmetsp:Transcript_90594/g.156972  ORF Transcript_90594/g.156972 Transcript_90594/m.156972 type:complete len:306 (-) Transcript_90594:2-919(-)